MITKLQQHQKYITQYLQDLQKRTLTSEELSGILENLKEKNWAGARSTVEDLVELLQQTQAIQVIHFEGSATLLRYAIGQVSDTDIIYSLASTKGYFSHSTAMSLLGITDILSTDIYLTSEQILQQAPKKATLTQQAITAAFTKPARLSNNIYTWKDYKITFLYRKLPRPFLGISKESNSKYLCTDVERTMLDIVVRPDYGGGSAAILQSFHLVRDRLDCERLCQLLQQMQFNYPYHQSVGFYLQHAGYNSEQQNLFRSPEFAFDFFLENEMEEISYDRCWRIFYPQKMLTHSAIKQ